MTFDNSLLTMASQGRVFHAYIITGDRKENLEKFAEDFISAVLCENGGCGTCRICKKIAARNHSDVLWIKPEDGHQFLNEQVEESQRFLMRKPIEGDRKICVMSDADMMTDSAQNRLLKTLEEPPEGAILLLLADNTEKFKQTVISRCVLHRMAAPDNVPGEKASKLAEELEEMINRGEMFYKLKAFAGKVGEDKELTIEVLDALERMYRDMLIAGDRKYSPDTIFENVEIIEEAKQRINRNIKGATALKYVILKIGG